MLRGVLNDRLEPIVVLEVLNGDGAFQPVEAVLDTGFTEHLTLPSDEIARLGLRRVRQTPMILADGQEVWAPMHTGFVNWFGRTRRIYVIAIEGQALIGMSLLRGCKISIRVQPGGEALIEEDSD